MTDQTVLEIFQLVILIDSQTLSDVQDRIVELLGQPDFRQALEACVRAFVGSYPELQSCHIQVQQ